MKLEGWNSKPSGLTIYNFNLFKYHFLLLNHNISTFGITVNKSMKFCVCITTRVFEEPKCVSIITKAGSLYHFWSGVHFYARLSLCFIHVSAEPGGGSWSHEHCRESGYCEHHTCFYYPLSWWLKAVSCYEGASGEWKIHIKEDVLLLCQKMWSCFLSNERSRS